MKNKSEIIRRTAHTVADLQIREAPAGEPASRTIVGYAILFGVQSAPLWSDEESEAREVIAPSAITQELLDSCDIKMTMFHNRQILLARSKMGVGTLTYKIDEKGVQFEFEAPDTQDGNAALELVKRGDLDGCSFAFTTRYYDEACVERTANVVNTRTIITYTVKVITGVYDFTITDNPAYPATSVEAVSNREAMLKEDNLVSQEKISRQLNELKALDAKAKGLQREIENLIY